MARYSFWRDAGYNKSAYNHMGFLVVTYRSPWPRRWFRGEASVADPLPNRMVGVCTIHNVLRVTYLGFHRADAKERCIEKADVLFEKVSAIRIELRTKSATSTPSS